MVTWLKKFSYSIWTKGIAVVLLCICAVLVVQGGIAFTTKPYEESYFETWQFQDEVTRKAGFVRDWIVRYSDEDIFNPEKITLEEIERYITTSIPTEEVTLNTEQTHKEESIKVENIEETPSVESIEGTQNTEDTDINERSKFERTRINTAKEGIIRDRKVNFKIIQQELLQDNINLEYLAINRKTGKYITNILSVDDADKAIEKLLAKEFYMRGDGATLYEMVINKSDQKQYLLKSDGHRGRYYNYYDGEDFLEQEDYEVYVAVTGGIRPGDFIYKGMIGFANMKELSLQFIYLLGVPALVGVVVLAIYGIIVVGKKAEDEKVYLIAIDKVPLEIQVIACGMGLFLCLLGCISVDNSFSFYQLFTSIEFIGPAVLLYLSIGAGCGWLLLFLSSWIRHLKNNSFIQNIGTFKIIKWILNNGITQRNIPIWTGAILVAYVVSNFLLILFMMDSQGILISITGFMWLGLNGLFVISILKIVMDYKKISRGIKQVANGNLGTKVSLKYTLPVMSEMAYTINHVGEGLESAVAEKIKSEKLKTELITNVSHDLKTPLTSIISYIDLLRQEEIDNETATEYIEMLSERSARLKQLVEDLVEASKVATGNVKTSMEVLELNQLISQALGEYGDRLEANDLEVVISRLDEISILADGRHMWRIIENLLSNVSKYAMSHTRVYVELIKEKSQGKLIIKNISKESLNLINPSELTERFVRGDKSRSTEGSGLGLAIAQSLVQVQGGEFKIDIDGDLFKVEIAMPIYHNEK